MDSLERFLLIASSDDVTQAIDFAALDRIAGGAQRTQYLGMALQNVLRQYTNAAASVVSDLLSFTTKFAIQVGISLILSFMVVWDLPAIQRGVESLRTSRVATIYNTVAPSLEVFATLFGKALQAQARIAMVNTILTCMGMWALQIPGVGLLSLFVFVCGFIPIAGVIISTVPIGFVALTEYGFTKVRLPLVAFVASQSFVALTQAFWCSRSRRHKGAPVVAVLLLHCHEDASLPSCGVSPLAASWAGGWCYTGEHR
jgi:predicted PurR-regulated permease PerM